MGPGGPRRDARPAVAQKELTEQVAPGVVYRQRNTTREGQPFQFQILEVDPTNPAINVLPVHALDRASGKETTTSMAKRYGATVAVNGGYFYVSGPLAGASTGVYQLNGKVVTSGDKRSSLIFCAETGGKEQTAVASAAFTGKVTAPGGATLSLSGMNRPREAGEVVLYTSMLGAATPALAGFEVIVSSEGRVQSVNHGEGASQIPPGGSVLSASGQAADWLKEHAPAGSALKIDARLDPAAAVPGCKPVDMIGAGPRLVRGDKIDVPEEGFNHANGRHPRTAFAVTAEGRFLFVTLDGRLSTSAGMTLAELANELLSMGAVEAINLDGGGSTTIVVNGVIRNTPSDGRERPVSDAILIFSIPDFPALEALVDRLGEGQIEAAFLARIRTGIAAARQSRQAAADLIRLVREAESREITPAAARLLSEAIESVTAGASAGSARRPPQ